MVVRSAKISYNGSALEAGKALGAETVMQDKCL